MYTVFAWVPWPARAWLWPEEANVPPPQIPRLSPVASRNRCWRNRIISLSDPFTLAVPFALGVAPARKSEEFGFAVT